MNLVPAAPYRTRFAQIAVRARHIVDSNLVPSTGAHVPDPAWAERTIARYGTAHPYVTSHVHAGFPAAQPAT
ncbi:hypothetical protein ACGFYQ_33885 [Streptomyces sp. NPDC048258]|uniref:hypothetical protein n=1 Tax=Streptomyces sp. NPDC048258 TaxID=3365527 RepID=UPI0037174689